MDLSEIAKKLSRNTYEVCRLLLPKGDRRGNEYFIGSVEGEVGDSCKIHLVGDKAGIWKDYSKDEKGGDLIDLWMKVKKISKSEAVREIKEYLNIKDTKVDGVEKKFVLPKISNYRKVTNDYLINRGLTKETIQAFRLAEKEVSYSGTVMESIVFPSFKDDNLTRVKYMAYDRPTGKKEILVEPNCKPILFGWHLIPPDTRAICIREGEINTMTLHQYGIPTLGLPFGAGKGHTWIEHEYQDLELFDTIYISMDDDEAGEAAVNEIAQRLGVHRCKIIKFPKDPNDLLLDGWTKEQILECFKQAEYFTPETLKTTDYFIEKAIRLRYPFEGEEEGFFPKFMRIMQNGPKIRFRPKETTIWTGYNFSGKSTFLKQMVLDGVSQGETFLIISPEEPGENILNDLTHMANGFYPTEDTMRKVSEWLSGKVWFYNVLDSVHLKDLESIMEYAIRRFGATQIIMDSIMCIDDVLEESLDSQRRAINTFVAFGKKFNCHNHVVAHPRKPPNEEFPPRPNRFSISGSSKFSDRADNVCVIWRNEEKEALSRGEIQRSPDDAANINTSPSAIFAIEKQKWGKRWIGKIGLHFDEDAHQYVDFLNNAPGRAKTYI